MFLLVVRLLFLHFRFRKLRQVSMYLNAVIMLSFFLVFAHSACRDAEGKVASKATAKGFDRSFMRGVNHAHIHRRGHGYGSAISARELDSLFRIGVNWIAIMPYGYQRGAAADKVLGFPGHEGESEFFTHLDETMTDDDIVQEILNAHQRGISVMVKPQIWSDDFWEGKEWHGSIRQSSIAKHAGWWKTYRAFALHYAGVAQKGNAEAYCLGTELVRMTTAYPNEWKTLIKDIRKAFDGQLTYAAHWDREYQEIAFWGELDFIGINAYFPLDAPSHATVKELVEAWEPPLQAIDSLVSRIHQPVLFTETGFRAVQGAHRKPWEYKGKKSDPDGAARSYEALFEALQTRPWLRGVFLWKTYSDPQRAYEPRNGSGYAFRRQPAEKIIRQWYLMTK